MKHVEIFGFAASTYVRTARLVCEEKHVDYQLKPLEFRQPSHRDLHPFLRMPVLRVGDVVLYETLAIAMFVDEAFDGRRLAPLEPLARARMLQWISTCNDYLYGDLVRALLEADDPAPETIAAARRDLEVVDRQMQGGGFLLGSELYLCDLFLAPMVAFVESKPSGQRLLHGLDGIAAWRERLWSRASFKRTQP